MKELIKKIPYLLPITSAFLLVLTLPPFNLWYLIFIAIAPIYIFIFQEKSLFRIFAGGIFFGLLFSGYLSFITLLGFTWIEETYLFSNLVKLLFIPIVILMSIITGLIWIFLAKLREKTRNPFERCALFSTSAVVELINGKILIGFNYGSIAYAAGHLPSLRFSASIGGVFLIAILVIFCNSAIVEAISFLKKPKARNINYLIPIIIFIAIISVFSFYQKIQDKDVGTDTSTISIAIIQDQERGEGRAFGKVVDGNFEFKSLEKYLEETRTLQPDIIIYPFSPWVGVISETLDNSGFDRDVIAVDFKTFGKWVKKYTPSDSTLVIWNTALRENEYWNELEFWKGDQLIGSYQKNKLFPFFDYTPTWSQKIGIYSTPYDATAGTSTNPIKISGVNIGGLVCSEVSSPETAEKNGREAGILFAIGSEAMFENPMVNEFNLLNSQLRSAEFAKPIVRANKFGPSAIIDSYGTIIEKANYGDNGILYGEFPINKKQIKTFYSRFREYPFLIILLGYLLLLWFRFSSRSSRN